MLLLLWLSIWILPQSIQGQSFIRQLATEFNIQDIAFIVLLICLLYTRLYVNLAVHKCAKFFSNPGKVHFEGLVHFFRYIRDNKNLGLKYYADLNDD